MIIVSIHTFMSTTSSCQPRHQIAGKRKSSEACEFMGENTLGPYVFSSNVVSGVAEVGCVFPQVRDSIWESCRQKAHRTAGLDLHVKNLMRSEHFWKMKLAKCAQDCSESSIL